MTRTRWATPRTLAKRLKHAREVRGMGRARLAELSGVRVSRIGSYERGEDKPGTDNLVALARALEVSVDWLAAGGKR